jgi:CheY-like chemotaxis protein
MVEMMSHSLDPRVRIVVDLPTDLPLVRIDRNQFELALLNLALNARDAMPGGGELRIKAQRADAALLPEKLAPGDYVHLQVADSGVGMDAETLRRASEPFFTTKSAGKGSGLGLSMVQGLTLQSGGAMQIASAANEGTCVSLWLPVARAELSAKEEYIAAEIGAAKLRILLVDDDPLVLTSTSDMLRELGHHPIEFSSAKTALEALRAGERPDLAIFDYAMPEMTGEALARLALDICPGLPLLLATGYAEQEKSEVDLPRLAKPFTITELNRQLSVLASSRR